MKIFYIPLKNKLIYAIILDEVKIINKNYKPKNLKKTKTRR